MSDAVLREGIAQLAKADEALRVFFPDKDRLIFQFNQFLNEIELFNKAYGLVACETREELIIRHLLDSLAPLGIILQELNNTEQQKPVHIADIGSGAGFPGMVLAIALPDFKFTLVERRRKRAAFLRNTTAVLALKNVCIEETPMEELAGASFQVVTFRALCELDEKSVMVMENLLQAGGFIAAYKGRKDMILDDIKRLDGSKHITKIIACPTPLLDEERHLLIIQQNKKKHCA